MSAKEYQRQYRPLVNPGFTMEEYEKTKPTVEHFLRLIGYLPQEE